MADNTHVYSIRLDPADYNRITNNGAIPLRDLLLQPTQSAATPLQLQPSPQQTKKIQINITLT